MYINTPPKVTELEVWSRLPDRFRTPKLTEWSKVNQGGRASDSFLEGPAFDGAGNLFVTDIPHGRVFRIDPKGEWDLVAQWEGQPNGMKFMNSYELLITDYANGLMALDTKTGNVRPYLTSKNSEKFKGLNDLTFDSSGNLYFTDQGQTGLHDPTGKVYRLSPDSKLDQLLSNVPSPNGITLSKDEKFLFVAATRGNCVWRMPILEDGSISKAGQFFTSHGPSGPDGLAINDQSNLLVANPGLAYIWVLNNLAEPIEILKGISGASLTNLAFGGKENKTLFCTDSTNGQIMIAQLEIPGASIHRLV